MPTVTVKIKLPDYNRKAFKDLLIVGKRVRKHQVLASEISNYRLKSFSQTNLRNNLAVAN